ncbi:MAG: hypothetical protein KDA84_16435, partial [Planctomycetaceae bacterium]|nr:hypothetical protein [Planctomycetaceae bacterium]
FDELAGWWDKFATTTVEDMPEVNGQDSVDSAKHVADTLRDWQQAGAAAGDISFWKKHIDRFQSAKAYALVVDALLEREDEIASMALLMQWLNQTEFVGLDSGPYSIYSRLTKWMQLTLDQAATSSGEDLQRTISRLFAYLEANAGELWLVPTLAAATGIPSGPKEETSSSSENDSLDEDQDDDEEDLFAAAYDEMTFRDSANDGQFSDTVDEGGHRDDTSFEVLARFLEPRLQLLETVAELWQMAASGLAPHVVALHSSTEPPSQSVLDFQDQLASWLSQIRRWQQGLGHLRKDLWKRPITSPSGDHDSNVEYDEQLQTKYYLLHVVISTDINCETAERSLQSCLISTHNEKTSPKIASSVPPHETIAEIYRGVLTRNASLVKQRLPQLFAYLIEQPLLYVPLTNDGEPDLVRAAQSLQSLIRFLLTQLPRLGLLGETWTLLRTAYRMERRSRPGGQAVTEFDQLFRTALKNSLDCVIRSSMRWRVASPSAKRTSVRSATRRR